MYALTLTTSLSILRLNQLLHAMLITGCTKEKLVDSFGSAAKAKIKVKVSSKQILHVSERTCARTGDGKGNCNSWLELDELIWPQTQMLPFTLSMMAIKSVIWSEWLDLRFDMAQFTLNEGATTAVAADSRMNSS